MTGIAGDQLGTQKDVIKQLDFDGLTHYQFVHFININRDYKEIKDDVEKEWETLDEDFKIPYYPHVSIGWDNNPRFEMFRQGVVKNNTPENLKKPWKSQRLCRCPSRQAPLITVNSWNEWTETST